MIMRFSAIGDVALWLPVVKRALVLNPDAEITFLTKKNTAFLFENIDRLHVIGVDVNTEFAGFFGLIRLAKFINQQHTFDTIIDGHDVLRTKLLKRLIKANQKFTFNKGRKEKENYIKTHQQTPLAHTTERYLHALQKAGVKIDHQFAYPNIIIQETDKAIAQDFIQQLPSKPIIGIAPFAKHQGKIYPLHKMENVITQLAQQYNILLFGAGSPEENQMQAWQQNIKNIYLTNTFNFTQQIALMQHCKVMLTMDSANMHLASLQAIKVVSVWGATERGIGFAALPSAAHQVVEINRSKLPCRPCSAFGNAPCTLTATPYACMQQIAEQSIVDTINQALFS
jgi:ADP-heptose:LPS heptosyltransferase